MTAFVLSVVQLCPAAYRDAANAIADAAGYGAGNLSVELVDGQGGTWWGCHAWWLPSALAAAINPPDEVPGMEEILTHVVTSVWYTEGMSDAELSGVAMQHWLQALEANGLSVINDEQVS